MKDFSYGIVAIDNEDKGNPLVLLVEQGGEFWSLPKGHAEAGETPIEAAEREFYEEAGLVPKKIYKNVSFSEHYFWKDKDILIDKTVVFFPALASGKPVVDNKEITAWQWLPFKEAIKSATYKETKRVLGEAAQWFLSSQQM